LAVCSLIEFSCSLIEKVGRALHLKEKSNK
jgi:hypothetical protein